jgi:hypothetical protein
MNTFGEQLYRAAKENDMILFEHLLGVLLDMQKEACVKAWQEHHSSPDTHIPGILMRAKIK